MAPAADRREEGLLEFTNLTDRAGAPVFGTHLHDVDRFVQNLTKSTATDAATSVALYEMLVPYQLKEHARERGNLVLVLDGNAARYPWELMQEKQLGDSSSTIASRERPLAVESGMVRQLKIYESRTGVAPATGDAAFVVGDPPTHLPPLPGARQEAREVQTQLKKFGFAVTPQIRPDDLPADETMDYDILKDLFVGSYRIIHLAGHGQLDRPDAALPDERQGDAGMVIGPYSWLTVDHIKNLRPVPEIVFVNCCYLGSVDEDVRQSPGDFPRLAANLGSALIEIGVRAVVAAGWAVEDEPARLFATTFYDEILQGETFGDAVRKSREATYLSSPGFNTWGAYQCYGDPAYRMTLPRTTGARTFTYNSWMEPVIDLENMIGRIKNPQPGELVRLGDEIRQIESSLADSWLKTGELRAALGAAYGEIEKYEEAVDQYAAAIAAEDGRMTLSAVGQWCNLEARLAAKLFLTGDPARQTQAVQRIDQAAQRLDFLASLQSTSELRSLRASIAKRRAMINNDPVQRKGALEIMAEGYEKASETSRQAGSKDVDPYSLVNYLASQVLLRGPQYALKAGEPAVEDLLKKAEQAARERDLQKPEFWNAVTAPDCDVVRALWNGKLTRAVEDQIIEKYQRALARSGSPRERGSVTEHLAFLQGAVQIWNDPKAAKAMSKSLERILGAIQS